MDTLVREHGPMLRSLALSIVGRGEEADDLVQDVFFRAFLGLTHLRDPSRVKSWLVTITIRQGQTRLRRRRQARTILPIHEVSDDALLPGEGNTEERVHIARLLEVVACLEPKHRRAWALRYVELESTQRVADQCGWSLRTAKRRLKSAREFVLNEFSA